MSRGRDLVRRVLVDARLLIANTVLMAFNLYVARRELLFPVYERVLFKSFFYVVLLVYACEIFTFWYVASEKEEEKYGREMTLFLCVLFLFLLLLEAYSIMYYSDLILVDPGMITDS